jgi:hypothetical protein
MVTVQQHYDELLAPIYVWMAGGLVSRRGNPRLPAEQLAEGGQVGKAEG